MMLLREHRQPPGRRRGAVLGHCGSALALLACAASPSPRQPGPEPPAEAAFRILRLRDTTADLSAVVGRVGDSTHIVLGAGRFRIRPPGIVIQGRRELTIEGAGAGRTILALDSTVTLGVDIRDSVVGFTLTRVTIAPLQGPQAPTQAFGSNTGRRGIRRVTVRDIEVKDLGLGISIGTGITGDYDSVVVEGNRLTNLVGLSPGQGYGIHNDNASHVRIANNEIRGAQRHSYYQARGSIDIRFEGNLIVDHGRSGRNPNPDIAALAIARSSHVVVIDNVIVNPYSTPISVEYDDVLGHPVEEIALIDNTVVGARVPDVWLNAGGRYLSCGNRYVHWPGVALDTLRRGAEGRQGSLGPDASREGSSAGRSVEPEMQGAPPDDPSRYPLRSMRAPTRSFVAQALGRRYAFDGHCLHEIGGPGGTDVVLDCLAPRGAARTAPYVSLEAGP